VSRNPVTPATNRTLGPWRCWALVVGGTIGSAVFMMPAILVPFGGLGLLSLAAAAIGAMSIAVMLGNLSRRVTTTGGPYAYARAGFGDFGGFLIAWGYWISLWTACAGMAIAFMAYIGGLVPAIGASRWLSMGAGLVLTWSFVAVNVAGVRESGIVGLVTTILKLLPLIVIGTVGLWYVDLDHLPRMNPGKDSAVYVFASAFALTFWNFVGIETASVPAEDVVNPAKTISRALITGTLTVALVYLLVAFAVMGMISPEQLSASESPLADAGRYMAGFWGGTAVSVGALVSIAGCLNVSILCAGQTAMAASRDRLFPAVFQRMTARNTPGASYVMVGVLISVMVIMSQTRGLVAGYKFVILISTLTAVIPYAFAAMAALLLDVHDRNIGRGRRIREAITAIVAFLICMWVIAAGGEESVYWVFLLLMAGIPVFVFETRNKQIDAQLTSD
jgi:APA family basic amino acid/polyamine antiporter